MFRVKHGVFQQYRGIADLREHDNSIGNVLLNVRNFLTQVAICLAVAITLLLRLFIE